VLTCTSRCQLDTGSCLVAPTCGNSFVDEGEQCDGVNFGGVSTSCASYSSSFESGELDCDGNCRLSTLNCVERNPCGNGVIDTGEGCDGLVFGGIDECVDIEGFDGGVISCGSECQLDTSGCFNQADLCGNNVVESGEQCDGVDLNGVPSSCAVFDSNFVSGVVSCTDGCVLSTIDCVERPPCGNGVIDEDEMCDGLLFVGGTNRCVDYSSVFELCGLSGWYSELCCCNSWFLW